MFIQSIGTDQVVVTQWLRLYITDWKVLHLTTKLSLLGLKTLHKISQELWSVAYLVEFETFQQ